MKKILTPCIIHEHPNILLGLKKRGFGSGRWNGFGGKVEAGEGIEEAARRELREEAGIDVSFLDRRGLIEFEFEGDPVNLEVHVFHGSGPKGSIQESDEMRPAWFPIEAIPYDLMWPDDRHWLPIFLSGKKFHGKFKFAGGEKEPRIIDSNVTVLN